MQFKKYLPLITFFSILLFAAFLRLYRINDYMAFLGDEGRDALIVKRIIVDHKLTLLGPITSVGLMHLGPMYYYFMIPFLWLFRLDPVGPAIMVALFSLGTIWLIWKMVREFFDERAALIAAFFYALSPLVIIHSHSSWNPNILPFWALLIIYSLLQVVVKKKYWWLAVCGISLGVALQLHYVALVFIPIIFGVLLFARFKVPLKQLVAGIIGALVTYSPFIIFELRHSFINTQTVLQFITRTGDSKTFTPFTFFNKFWDLSVRLVWRLLVIENAEFSIICLLGIVVGIGFIYMRSRKMLEKRTALIILALWFGIGISLLSLYTGNIFDYYLMFVFPLPFIFIGIVFSSLMQKIPMRILILGCIGMLAFFQIKSTSILKVPNKLAAQTKGYADFILSKTENKPYNFALIAGQNSDHAYRYFLEIGGNPPTEIKNEVEDPQRLSVTDQLLVICEEKICQPLGHPRWEIAGYGRAEIADEWQVGFFKVFKLVPYLETP